MAHTTGATPQGNGMAETKEKKKNEVQKFELLRL